MSKLIYIVLANAVHSNSEPMIDSLWTSEKKAQKRCNELNNKGLEYLTEECGCGLYDVILKRLSK